VLFSLRGVTDSDEHARSCRREAQGIRRAVASYQSMHPSAARPSVEELTRAGKLLGPPAFYSLEYTGSPPALELREVPGADCGDAP
jgi:hypothetical protein